MAEEDKTKNKISIQYLDGIIELNRKREYLHAKIMSVATCTIMRLSPQDTEAVKLDNNCPEFEIIRRQVIQVLKRDYEEAVIKLEAFGFNCPNNLQTIFQRFQESNR